MLATNPNASVRNGIEAMALAERALQLSGGSEPAVLDALAAAYAEAGRFAEAAAAAAKPSHLLRDRTSPLRRTPCGPDGVVRSRKALSSDAPAFPVETGTGNPETGTMIGNR